MAKQRIKTTENTVKSSETILQETLNSADIAALAYRLWQDRGCPVDSPEADWFQAEQYLRQQANGSGSQQVSKPLLVRSRRA